MGSRCSEKVDIFSLGVVLWELVTGKHTRGVMGCACSSLREAALCL